MAGASATIPLGELNKLEKLAHKGGAIAKRGTEWSIMKLGKHQGAIMALALGAVGWFVISNKAWSTSIWSGFAKYWWAKPLAVLGLGWLLYYKKTRFGTAVLMLGAILFVQSYRQMKWAEAMKKTPENAKLLADLANAKTEGSWYGNGDTGAPFEFDAGGRWVKDANGGEVFMPDGNNQPDTFGQTVFNKARAS
jgi:hypothetical protein